jgi:hypothetical protein
MGKKSQKTANEKNGIVSDFQDQNQYPTQTPQVYFYEEPNTEQEL